LKQVFLLTTIAYLKFSKVSLSGVLSKIFEENARGTVDELTAYFTVKTEKGEIVVVLAREED
jgi:16S rRNA C1402 (ribose-2'-O) methylase RsmI